MADAVVQLVQSRAVVTVGGGELVALKAALAAEPFAVRAEAALGEIEDLASGSPTAPSILNKLDKGANLADLSDVTAARANLGVRDVGNRVFFVRPDGSDANTGLANTTDGAFQTIQKAVNAAYGIDARGSVTQIRIADGTYPESVNIFGRLVGAFDNSNQPFRIIGNEANPQNVIINPTNADALRLGDKATVLLAGVTIGTIGSGNGIFASNGTFLWHRNVRFAACAGETISATSNAFVQSIGPTTVVGGSAAFVHVTNKATVSFSGRPLTFSGNPTFSTYLWGVNDATVDLASAAITGKAAGGITVHIGGILNVSSCTGVWTGGQQHRVATGGQIIAEDKMALKTFYVRPDGNNQNSGFDNTADGAFLSIQAAVNRLAQMPYDLAGYENDGSGAYDWRIVVAAGTFSEAITLLDTRFPRVTIEGASPTTTITTSYISRSIRTAWKVRNQQLGGAGITCLTAIEGAQLGFENINFVASAYLGICDTNGRLQSGAQPFSIGGNLTTAFLARTGGRIAINNSAVAITGTPAIGKFAMAQQCASINAAGMVFTGSATGSRYDARSNGVIETNGGGANFFPGDTTGGVSSGGQYV